MRRRLLGLSFAAFVLPVVQASATMFVVPPDAIMADKSEAIVSGTVMYSYPTRDESNFIETVSAVEVNESLKGRARLGDLIEVYAPGGVIGREASVVHASPSFTAGEEVVLLLIRHRGRWEVTDLALGAFHVRQVAGRQVLLRSAEVEGSNIDGSEFHDRARDEGRFIDYLRHVSHGERPVVDYMIETRSGQATSLAPAADSLSSKLSSATFQPSSYTSNLSTSGVAGIPGCCPSYIGTRWRQTIEAGAPAGTQAMPSGVTYYWNSTQNLVGASDGTGVSIIQNGLANWNNDCASAANLVYGGGRAANSVAADEINVIEYNDPTDRVAGSFNPATGGTVAVTFSNFNNIFSINGEWWWVFNDADIVFQDGVTATNIGILTAMTHELGHSIGWRHSNATRTNGNDSGNSCNGVDEECAFGTGSAIMYWQESGSGIAGGALQPWDQHAVRAVYPGGSCARTKADFNADHKSDLVWRNTVTGQQALWFMNGLSPLNTVFISGAGSPWEIGAVGDLNNDGWPDLVFRNYVTGQTAVWFMSGSSIISTAYLPSVSTDWKLAGSADFNGDGYDDLVFRNAVTGDNALWYMNGATVTNSVFLNGVSIQWTLCGAADMDGDGKPDLIWRNYTTGQNAIWYMQNNVLSSTAYFSSVPTNWRLEAMGDFDGNGTTDFVFRDDVTGQNAMWFMNNATVTNTAFMVGVGTDWQLMGGR